MTVRVQEADFDIGAELNRLTEGNRRIGGLAVFVGLVREMHMRDGLHRERIDALTLEHYPGMTEKALESICGKAKSRFDIRDTLIIHRVGELRPTDQIVLVAVTSAHRGEAFAACEFIMDYLKTEAPFWKKEATPQGQRWVEARQIDDEAAARWRDPQAGH